MNSSASTRTNRILVVDDDARIRDLLRRYLTQEGFEVLLAEDSRALNKQLTRETVDLIVLDLNLPRLDGLTVLKRWRAEGCESPVLILTARGAWTVRVEGIDAGADDYLPKPFRMEELIARARAALCEVGEGFKVGASCGHALLSVEAHDAVEALRVADRRLYAEKNSGRVSARAQSARVLRRALATIARLWTPH